MPPNSKHHQLSSMDGSHEDLSSIGLIMKYSKDSRRMNSNEKKQNNNNTNSNNNNNENIDDEEEDDEEEEEEVKDIATTTTITQRKKQRSTKKTKKGMKSVTTNTVFSDTMDTIHTYIPLYLRPFVKPYHGDFCYSPYFHPMIVSQLLIEGFLTIASRDCLLPKLHEQRCVIELQEQQKQQQYQQQQQKQQQQQQFNLNDDDDKNTTNGTKLHTSKSTRKKSGRFDLTINEAFEDVILGCQTQHGAICWLYPPLVQAFRIIHAHTTKAKVQGSSVVTVPSSFPTKIFSNDTSIPPRLCHLRLYSIEIWNKSTGELAGGELGYTVGSIYTSLTGFSVEDSAGSVQLAALGALLIQRGFTLWDLGMDMNYKRDLGATLMSRKTFVRTVHAVRERYGHLTLCLPDSNKMNCKDILMASRMQCDNAGMSACNSTKKLTVKKPTIARDDSDEEMKC